MASTSSLPETPTKTVKADLGSTSAQGKSRISEMPGRSMLQAGGVGYIARRGVPFRLALMLVETGGVETLAQFQPLTLLMLMADMIPELSTAVWNFLLLGCSPGTVRLKAMTADADGNSEEAPDGTAAIEAMFNAMPQECGDFDQQLEQNVLQVLFSGMAATEAVPGPELTGITASYPVDTLTLSFRRADDKSLVIDQRQGGPYTGQNVGATPYSATGTNMVPMPMVRFFWDSMHRFPGDPYGRAPFASALTAILEYLGFMRDLVIAFHRIGMPRYDVTFNFEGAILLATQVKGLTEARDIAKDVKDQFDQFRAAFDTLEQDDTFFHPTGTAVETTGGGKEFPAVDAVFNIFRYRVILALHQNPVLMSFVEGSTETWSDIQWELATAGLKAVVRPGCAPLVDTAQLHLRLLGMPYTVEAEFQDVRSISRLEDAQAEQIEILNEAAKRDEGWQTQDTASQAITGSGAVADAPGPVAMPPAAGDTETGKTAPGEPKPPPPAPGPTDGAKQEPGTKPATPPNNPDHPAPAKPETPPHKKAAAPQTAPPKGSKNAQRRAARK